MTGETRRGGWLRGVFVAAAAMLSGPAHAQAPAPVAVPTFECIGLTWAPGTGSAERECGVQYRAHGASEWREALPLWYDARNGEYRGSLVNLRPGTPYEIMLSLKGTATSAALTASTWSETFPVARTISLPDGLSKETFVADQSGTPQGYVLYTAPPGSCVDAANAADCCVRVKASYVILRGLTLRGARVDGIRLDNGVHDVVIERCDISGWGRIEADGWGHDYDAGIRGGSSWGDHNLQRITIQRNRIHDPRSNSNDWSQLRVAANSKHPQGAQGVVWIDTLGNHVIRYNEIASDEEHRFNDGIGGGSNFGAVGFPGPNSDVYGNVVTNACDDALEIEGGGCNVRVWGNYLDRTYVGIATCAVTVGPLYLFRNVLGMTRMAGAQSGDGVLGKLGDKPLGPGRQYWLHNTALPGGTKFGITNYGGSYTNCISYNNLVPNVIAKNKSTANLFDYDLIYNARVDAYDGAEPHGIKEKPLFAPGQGEMGRSGRYALAPGSPGLDKGLRLPGFNDDCTGVGPDMGAHEAGTPPMQFGVDAYLDRR